MKKYLELLCENFVFAGVCISDIHMKKNNFKEILINILVFAFCILDFTLSSVAAPGIISTVAGTGEKGFSGDGGKAAQAKLNFPRAIFVDSLGNLLIADEGNNRIRRVSGQTGIITTIAGGGCDDLGDGKQATKARLWFPTGIFVDLGGNLLIANARDRRVRRMDGQTGIITTVAGGGIILQSDEEVQAIQASLNRPICIFVDSFGNLFIADEDAHRICRVDGKTGIITTVAGTGEADFSGDGGKATEAGLDNPTSIFVDSLGNLFIADTKNHRIRRVDGKTGIITTVAGTGEADFSGDGGKATEAGLDNPTSIFVDSLGNLFIADTKNHRIRRADGKTGVITTVAGTGAIGYSGDGGQATETKLNYPYGVFVDFSGNLFIVGYNNHCIWRVEGVAAPTILGGIFAPRTDMTPPALATSFPKDGEKNIVPDVANQNGIIITLNEPIDTAKIQIRLKADGQTLIWHSIWTDSDTKVTLLPTRGNELTFEMKYTVTLSQVVDEAGNDSETITITFTTAKKWDINQDGIVDISDLALAGKQFGKIGVGIIGDVNGDGRVDITDLALIGNHFGENDTLIW